MEGGRGKTSPPPLASVTPGACDVWRGRRRLFPIKTSRVGGIPSLLLSIIHTWNRHSCSPPISTSNIFYLMHIEVLRNEGRRKGNGTKCRKGRKRENVERR